MLKGRESEGGGRAGIKSLFTCGRILEFGAVLEHVCQLLVFKVVHLEVIWVASWKSISVASWSSLWNTIGVTSCGLFGRLVQVCLGLVGASRGKFGCERFCWGPCRGMLGASWRFFALSQRVLGSHRKCLLEVGLVSLRSFLGVDSDFAKGFMLSGS